MRRVQSYFVGEPDACAEWLRGFVDAGASHLVLRIASLDPVPHLETIAERVLPQLRS
jgi:alkanesulfonate monooxygenase SsuD/methylene tetrahydromethanopterin reductase-like flavin-dependent oxidoreductase (luciferase family)